MFQSLRCPAVAKASAAAALVASAITVGPVQSAFAVPAFYTPPATLPAENGALVRTGSLKLGINVPSPEGTATRIMYKSTDTNGNPVAITGAYIEPTAGWNGSGPRPLVSYAEGTQGQGDYCAPSLGLENLVGGRTGSLNLAYDVPTISSLVNKGVAVVVTDYVGLGTTDQVHTYVNRVDQGHAVLDAARAAAQVPGATLTPTSPVGAYGYSQGGGAAASAAELQPLYAPDLNFKGAYAGAPPADLNAVMKTADGTSLTGVIGYAINGFVQTYPYLKPIIDANTNATGKGALAKVATQCGTDTQISFGNKKTSTWTKSGKSISQIVAATPIIKAVVDAQKVGTLKPAAPVRIATGTLDDIVTHSQVKQLATDWCSLGANVSYVPIRQYLSSFGTGLNHLGPSVIDAASAQQWMTARLNGVPIASNCSSIPSLP